MNRPNIEQYKEVIKNGDDSRDKNVVLNFDGTFELEYNFNLANSNKYVGRSETLDAGNDYVGLAASQDDIYINKSYAMFLKAWINYKKNGSIGQYLDIYPTQTVEELEKKISEL